MCGTVDQKHSLSVANAYENHYQRVDCSDSENRTCSNGFDKVEVCGSGSEALSCLLCSARQILRVMLAIGKQHI